MARCCTGYNPFSGSGFGLWQAQACRRWVGARPSSFGRVPEKGEFPRVVDQIAVPVHARGSPVGAGESPCPHITYWFVYVLLSLARSSIDALPPLPRAAPGPTPRLSARQSAADGARRALGRRHRRAGACQRALTSVSGPAHPSPSRAEARTCGSPDVRTPAPCSRQALSSDLSRRSAGTGNAGL